MKKNYDSVFDKKSGIGLMGVIEYFLSQNVELVCERVPEWVRSEINAPNPRAGVGKITQETAQGSTNSV